MFLSSRCRGHPPTLLLPPPPQRPGGAPERGSGCQRRWRGSVNKTSGSRPRRRRQNGRMEFNNDRARLHSQHRFTLPVFHRRGSSTFAPPRSGDELLLGRLLAPAKVVSDFAQTPMLGNGGDKVTAVDRPQVCQTRHDLALVSNTLPGQEKSDGGEGQKGELPDTAGHHRRIDHRGKIWTVR